MDSRTEPAGTAPASTAQARERHLVDEVCGAAVRALAADPSLHYRAGRLHDRHGPVRPEAAHLHPDLDRGDFTSFRGAVDGFALRLRLSSTRVHESHAPDDDAARLVYDLLEQYRVESLVPHDLPGMVSNLRHRHVAWVREFLASGLTESTAGLLLFTVALVCRSRLARQPVPEIAEDTIEATRFALAPLMGEDLAELRSTAGDQAAFAPVARGIADRVSAAVHASTTDGPGDTRAFRTTFSLLPPQEPDDARTPPPPGRDRPAQQAPGYRVFTRAHDAVLRPAEASVPSQLRRWRAELDEAVSDGGVSLNRLARTFAAMLTERQEPAWSGGHPEGLVDSGRVSMLVSSPTERRIFRAETLARSADCTVSFLVDCSGSMRRHVRRVAALLDVTTRALDLAGVDSEVVGFSTRSWHGGRALRDWERAGRPPDPGRLAEMALLVFKDADTSWRRSRRGIAAMLRPDSYREGIDGEAVAWAASRLLARTSRRRLLVVLSDGSPSDRATALANHEHYLDAHLRSVVDTIADHGAVTVAGLGVGLDLSPYYRVARQVDLDQVTAVQAVRELVRLMARAVR